MSRPLSRPWAVSLWSCHAAEELGTPLKTSGAAACKYTENKEFLPHFRWRATAFQSITLVLPSILGECVRLWSWQQRTLASLLGKQHFRWGFPEDRRPWRGFWVQYNFDSCLHWKNKVFQGQMTLATGTSGGCNFQHAAEQSSVKMIWAPGRFGCMDLRWVWSLSHCRERGRGPAPSCTRFPLCGEPGAANQLWE